MNERLIIKSFGPVRDIDIVFRKVTVFIGDQGSGKSCVAKLFSLFVWLEKQLVLQRQNASYYEKYNRFITRLCAYHRIDSFFNGRTFIRFEGNRYIFTFQGGSFYIDERIRNQAGVPQVLYIPAERSIVSIAENRPRLLKELPDSCETFFDEVMNAKRHFRNGYDLPFGNLHFDYDQLNDTGWVVGPGYKVRLINASSGIQSALPMCMVTEYLAKKVSDKQEVKLSIEERERMQKRVAQIMQDDGYTDSIKEMMLKHLSADTVYDSFINIVEEPELSLFPETQMGVLFSLVKNCNASTKSMLVMTTHSPYTLAILNLMILAGKIPDTSETNANEMVESICRISTVNIAAYRLSETDEAYCQSIISETTGLVSKNDLDAASQDIMQRFNNLYRIYAGTRK